MRGWNYYLNAKEVFESSQRQSLAALVTKVSLQTLLSV
jgi:hypothetical protein